MSEPIILKSYGNVWHLEKTIYHIGGKKLIMPIPVRQAAYFAAVAAGVFILSIFVPFLNHITWIIRYVLIPYLLSSFFEKKLLDGKTPISYLQSMWDYMGSPKLINRYKPLKEIKQKILYDTPISYRETVIFQRDDMIRNTVKFV